MAGENFDDPKVARIEDQGEIHPEAWSRTLEEMELIAEDRRKDGWSVTTIMTPHTDGVSKDMGDHDRFGLMHIIPNNYIDDFLDAYDGDAYTDYLFYTNEVDSFVYGVIELIDPEHERSILIAFRYDMIFAGGMVGSAMEEGRLYSHIKRIDGEILASIPYEEYEGLVRKPPELRDPSS